MERLSINLNFSGREETIENALDIIENDCYFARGDDGGIDETLEKIMLMITNPTFKVGIVGHFELVDEVTMRFVPHTL